MSKFKFIARLAIIMSFIAANSAYAQGAARKGVCNNDHNRAVVASMKRAKENVCAQLDTNVSLDGSPYVYRNPDATCNLGFSMPGLPDIGIGLEGIDSCKILKAVTGDLVKSVNQRMREAVDEAVDDVSGGRGDLTYDIDLGQIAIDEYNEYKEFDDYRNNK